MHDVLCSESMFDMLLTHAPMLMLLYDSLDDALLNSSLPHVFDVRHPQSLP